MTSHPCQANQLKCISAKTILRLFVLVAVLVLTNACSKTKESPIPPGSRVLALGDSLTAGAGVTPEEAWPTLLAAKTGWVVINGGVSGNTSGDALQRLPSLLEQHSPVLVLVTVGGNDMLRHLPEAETIANLEKTLVLIRAQGAKAVLLAIPQPSLTAAVFRNLSAPDYYRQVADAQKVPLIKDAIADVLSNPQLKVDQIHPNAEGHALLAEKISKELQSIGFAPQ
jgi:lysophospholipase L1-like esterase